MPDLFADAATWLSDQLSEAKATRKIALQSGLVHPEVILENIDATPGQSHWDEESGDASVVRVASRDFIVETRLLITVDGLQLPQRGWIITDSLDGTQYECVPATGETVWDWSDTGHVRIRIHTQSLDRAQ